MSSALIADMRLDGNRGPLLGYLRIFHENAAARFDVLIQLIGDMDRVHHLEPYIAVNAAKIGEVQLALRLAGRDVPIVAVVRQDCDHIVAAVERDHVGNIDDKRQVPAVVRICLLALLRGRVVGQLCMHMHAVDPDVRDAHHALKFYVQFLPLFLFRKREVLHIHTLALVSWIACAAIHRFQADAVRQVDIFPTL